VPAIPGFRIAEWVFLAQFTPKVLTNNRCTTTAIATNFAPSGTAAPPLAITAFGGPNNLDESTDFDWRLTMETDGAAGNMADSLSAFIELVATP
jgi:hypothetical protein